MEEARRNETYEFDMHIHNFRIQGGVGKKVRFSSRLTPCRYAGGRHARPGRPRRLLGMAAGAAGGGGVAEGGTGP